MALGLGFSHAVLKVNDLEAMLAFYTEVLEFDVVDRGPVNLPSRGELGALDTEIVFLSQDPTDHHQLALLPIRPEDGPAGPVDHLAFRAADIGAVRALAQELTERGVGIRPVSHGNTWSCYFADPEGNGIEIFADTPFHVAQPQVRPVDLSLDDEALLAWTTETFGQEPGFGPRADYEAARAADLSSR